MTKRLLELDAYLTNEHANPDAFEDALFDAPDDPDLAFFDRLQRHGARLADHGTFEMGCTWETIQALIDRGHRVQVEERMQPGSHTVEIDADAEFLVTKIFLGRTDLERVDVEIDMPAVGGTKTVRDVVVDRREGGVIYALCERPLAEIAFGAGRSYVKVRERGGERRVIVEYAFNEHLA